MKSAHTALAAAVLLGGSVLLGTAPANAIDMPTCPPAMHLVMDPGSTNSGTCVADPAPPPTAPIASGNNWSIWAGTPSYAPGPPPVQPPPYKPLPAPAAPEVPGQVIQVPAGEARPGSVVAGGNRTGPNWSPEGTDAPSAETLQAVTPMAGQATVEEPAPATPVVVLPATEGQAVAALRSATATHAEKDAATAIVTAKITAVLDQAIAAAAGTR